MTLNEKQLDDLWEAYWTQWQEFLTSTRPQRIAKMCDSRESFKMFIKKAEDSMGDRDE